MHRDTQMTTTSGQWDRGEWPPLAVPAPQRTGSAAAGPPVATDPSFFRAPTKECDAVGAAAEVQLEVAIEGLEGVKSERLRTTIIQAAREIRPQNDRIVMSVLEVDGSICMRVYGLTKVIAKQLAPSQWSLSQEQADCVRSVQFDAKIGLLRVILTDANRALQPSRASANGEDGCDDDVSSESENECGSAEGGGGGVDRGVIKRPELKTAALRNPMANLPARTEPKAATQKLTLPPPTRQPRKPFYVLEVSPVEGPTATNTAVSAPAPATTLAQPAKTDAITEQRKARLPPVARAVAQLAGATALQRETLTIRAEMFRSHRPMHCYCTVNVGGIVVFDWRLLTPAAWPEIGIPTPVRMGFEARFDVSKKELVVRISPPSQVDHIYDVLLKSESMDAAAMGGSDNSDDECRVPRKRARPGEVAEDGGRLTKRSKY